MDHGLKEEDYTRVSLGQGRKRRTLFNLLASGKG